MLASEDLRWLLATQQQQQLVSLDRRTERRTENEALVQTPGI